MKFNIELTDAIQCNIPENKVEEINSALLRNYTGGIMALYYSDGVLYIGGTNGGHTVENGILMQWGNPVLNLVTGELL